MSGQIVGEVFDARAGHLADLTQAETLALVAIAEKCHADSRQGAVWQAHVEAAIGKSKRTAVRTIERLKDRGLIRVVKRGYKSHGVVRPNIYEIAVLAPPSMAQANEGGCASQDGASADDVLAPNPGVLAPDSDVVAPSLGGVLNGSRDGSKDGDACADEADPSPPDPFDHPNDPQDHLHPFVDAAPAAAGPPTWVRGPYGPRCRKHVNDRNPPGCWDCKEAGDEAKAEAEAEHAAEKAAITAIRAEIDACGFCDQNGLTHGDKPRRCTRHRQLSDARRAS